MIGFLRRCVARLTATPRLARWAAAIAWAALLWSLSARSSGGGSRTLVGTFVWNGAHVAAYFVLGALLFLALREAARAPRWRAIAAVAIGACYGMIDEWHQSTVPGRDCSGWDVLSDGLGAALATLSLLWLEGRVRLVWLAVIVALSLGSVAGATFAGF